VTHLPAGSAARDGYEVCIDPETAGWEYTRLRVLALQPGGSRVFAAGDSEWIVLPLAGACALVVDGEPFALRGRRDVFSAVTDFAYLPRDSRTELSSPGGGRFALAGARCARRLPPRYGPADAVPVELRGAGNAGRQVNNFAAADAFPCDRLIAVEVLTPGGNWSSYPPHKHDEPGPHESRLEEIYYYEFAGGPAARGYQRVYPSPAGPTDLLAEVATGDAVLIPDGWHGPSTALPGYDMYYLNVMAGPGPLRQWLISDDPAHAWVRETWPARGVDGRLPLYTAPLPPLPSPPPVTAEPGVVDGGGGGTEDRDGGGGRGVTRGEGA
jgi:5-deoxy-glucuronate isomerase